MGESLVIDPITEDASNVPLNINDGVHFAAMTHSYPTPERSVNWSSSADTEGELAANLRYQNRTITIEVRVYGSSAEDSLTQIGKLEQKVGKINDGRAGTLRRTTASGKVIVFDLLAAAVDVTQDNDFLANFRSTATITFIAKPFGRGEEVTFSDHSETTLPVLVFTDPAPDGDVPALARLVVDNDSSTHDQATWLWGLQTRHYDSAAEAELFLQAEKLTPLGSAELKEATGGTPTGKNSVFQGNLLPTYISVLSTKIASSGHDLSHVGSFRVFGRFFRPATNTGEVTVALQWAQGDFQQKTLNESTTWAANELEGEWVTIDLGLVELTPVTAGQQRWQGQILAKSSVVGDDIYIDCVYLFPTDEGYGELDVVNKPETPTTLTIYENFIHGNTTELKPLEGYALEVGTGSWTAAGRTGTNGWLTVTDELSSEGKLRQFGVAARTIGGDTDHLSGAYALAGSATFSSVSILAATLGYTIVPSANTGSGLCGVLARYVSTEKWLFAGWELVGEGTAATQWGFLTVIKRTTAGAAVLSRTAVPTTYGYPVGPLELEVTEAGLWTLRNSTHNVTVTGTDTDLATGGTLASGKVGLYDAWVGTTNLPSRSNFLGGFEVFVPANKPDAAIFAGKSAQVRWDRLQRQDREGIVWVDRRDYKGSYLRVPAAGMDERHVRVITKLARGQIGSSGDGGIDPLSGRLYVQPRFLVVPEP